MIPNTQGSFLTLFQLFLFLFRSLPSSTKHIQSGHTIIFTPALTRISALPSHNLFHLPENFPFPRRPSLARVFPPSPPPPTFTQKQQHTSPSYHPLLIPIFIQPATLALHFPPCTSSQVIMSSSEGNTKKPLTERELEILKHAWNCMKTPPEVRTQPSHRGHFYFSSTPVGI